MLLVQICDARYMEIVCGEISVTDLQAFAKIVSQLLVGFGHQTLLVCLRCTWQNLPYRTR